jgi:hypothetical protein
MNSSAVDKLQKRKAAREERFRFLQRQPLFHFITFFCVVFTAVTLVCAVLVGVFQMQSQAFRGLGLVFIAICSSLSGALVAVFSSRPRAISSDDQPRDEVR